MPISRGIGTGTKLAYCICMRWGNGNEHTFQLTKNKWKSEKNIMTSASLRPIYWWRFEQIDGSLVQIKMSQIAGLRFFIKAIGNPLNDPRHYDNPLN